MNEREFLLENDELTRLDIEWLAYNAIREGVALSLGTPQLAGHRDTLLLSKKLAPELFASDESLLYREMESLEIREVRELAVATGISFEQALTEEINRYKNLVDSNKDEKEDLRTLKRRLSRLQDIQSETSLQEYYEGKLIERDAKIGGYAKSNLVNKDGYFDFTLPKNKITRIRVTHETKVESINGADLIYEHHDSNRDRVRIVAVQYKILRDERIIPKSRKLKSQLERLEKCFCQEIPCRDNEEQNAEFTFRLPTCSAFLRPTYRLQNSQASVMSRGYYMPICVVNSLWQNKKEINEQSVDGQVVKQAVFDELFDINLLGSKWITTTRLDEIYKKQKILQPSESSVVHVKYYS